MMSLFGSAGTAGTSMLGTRLRKCVQYAGIPKLILKEKLKIIDFLKEGHALPFLF
jgi:hypothetical protein